MSLQYPRNTGLLSLGKTNTFRAASSALFEYKPHFDGYGTNLQNITDNLRQIYIPDEGYKLGGPDQSGAEALIVAYLCRPGKYRELFIHNIKPHTFVALHLFKDVWKKELPHADIDGLCATEIRLLNSHPDWKSVAKFIKDTDKWPAQRRYYYMAKQTCHSSNYGIKAPTFMLNTLEKSDGKVVLTKRDAEFFLTTYRGMLFPEIVEWNIAVWELYNKTHKLFNLFGHPREFTGDDKDTEVYAFIPQSTVGEITHVAYREMQSYIEHNEKDWHMLVNTHDGYLAEYPEEDEEEFKVTCNASMEQTFTSPYDGVKFSMKSEWKGGMDWMHME